MNHKEIAKQLRSSRFKTYPNGGTARSQAFAMIQDLTKILEIVRDHEDVPPWVIMKLSEAKSAVDSASNYISYQSQKGS